VDDEVVRLGLARVEWRGRMQVVQREGGRRLLLDGAHNLAGMEALLDALACVYPGCRPTFVLGMMQDKDGAAMLSSVARATGRVVLVPIRSECSATPEGLAATYAQATGGPPVETASSLREALDRTAAEPFVVVAGSLYLVGEAMELLELSPAEGESERGLNDWLPEKGSPEPGSADGR
jgi:dihydrofolate synthase/folylpolyglutamate synthase